MPVPQIDPPGHLAIHLELVALTPVLLAWVGGLAGRISGGRTGRVLATTGSLAGLALLGLDLRPRGLARAVDHPLGREWLAAGIARVSWPTIAAALLAGLWMLATAIRAARQTPGPATAWRCGLAQALAIVPLPALVIACAWDDPGVHPPTNRNRRWFLIATAVILTVCAVLLPSPWPHLVATALAALLLPRWRVPLLLATLAAAWPLPHPAAHPAGVANATSVFLDNPVQNVTTG
jgi:hypothetical protein